jgi:phage-related protein
MKHLAGSTPRLFEIKRGPLRLIGCRLESDFVVLHWLLKKSLKLPDKDVRTSEERAERLKSAHRKGKVNVL